MNNTAPKNVIGETKKKLYALSAFKERGQVFNSIKEYVGCCWRRLHRHKWSGPRAQRAFQKPQCVCICAGAH